MTFAAAKKERRTKYSWLHAGLRGVLLLLALTVRPAAAVPIGVFQGGGTSAERAPTIVLDGRAGAQDFEDVNEQLQAGRYQEIIAHAKAVITRQPKSGLAYEVLGTAYFASGQLNEAAAAFAKAAKLEPQQSGSWTKLGIMHMEAGKLDEAESLLQKAVEVNPGDRFAHQRLGLLYEYQKNYDKAIDQFRKGLEGTDRSYLGVAVNLGRVLNELKRYQETIETLGPRAPIASPVPEAHSVLGTAYLAMGQYVPAQLRFERVMALQPDSSAGRLGLGRALRGAGETNKSLEVLESLVKERPDWVPAVLELGETQLSLQQLPQAKRTFAKAVQLGASSVSVNKRIAAYHLGRKEFAEAEKVYRALVKAGEADPASFAQLAELLQAQAKHEEGLQVLRQGLSQFPDSAYLHFRLGSYLAALGRYKEGVPELQQALKLAPDDPTVLKAVTVAAAKAGETEVAVQAAARLHELMPEGIAEAVSYATRLEANGQGKQAAQVYRQVLASEPQNVLVLNNLSNLLAENGELKEAEKLARQASELLPDNGNVRDTLGWILYRQGRLDEALPVLEQANKLAPQVAVIWYHKGIVLIESGNAAAGKGALQEALRLDGAADWADDAQARLKGAS